MKRFLIIIIIIFSINIISFYFFENPLPEKNIVSVEKQENILNNFFEQKKVEKIVSKWIFINKNLVLTVAHWVDTKNDNYKIFLDWKIFQAKLIKKDEKNDIAILKTNENYNNFYKITFWQINENDFIFYYNWVDFTRLEISKIENNKIFTKNIFKKWDSGTIFFNHKRQIIWILQEINLDKKEAIIKILYENLVN